MEQLQFYTEFLDSNLLNSIGGLNGKLIQMVRSGKYKTEESLSKAVAKDKGHQYYLNLKQRTLKILSAFLLVTPPKNKLETTKERWDCRRKYFSALCLIESGERDLAWKPLLQSFRLATEIEYSEIAQGAATQLMTASALKRKSKDFEKYKTLSEKYLNDISAEFKMRSVFYQYAKQLNEKKSVNYHSLSNQLEELSELKCDSLYFVQHFYSLRILIDINSGKYPLVKHTADAAIKTLKNRRGIVGSSLQLYYKCKTIAQIALKDPRGASASIRIAENYSIEKTFNWGILQYYKALNYLHARNYKQAHALYREHRKNKFGILEEHWLIMGAYLFFLREIGLLKAPFERFKIGKYINDTSPSAHDKKGSNVNVLIGELLVYLVSNKATFIQRVDAINQYSYRYLKGEHTKRARWFIRMLCKIPKADFNYELLNQKGEDYVKKINSNPVSMGDNLSLEIIPFDHLIEIIKDKILSKKSTYSK